MMLSRCLIVLNVDAETNQERLIKGEHVDYLFHRLLAFIQMILRTSGRV